MVSITNPLAKTWTIARLATGEPQQITDPLAHTTTFAYDTYGHLASVQDHLGNTTSYTYDLIGRRLTATDPRGFITRNSYDALNRLVSTANPLAQAVRFEYDANSNMTKVTDPRGGQIVYTYTTMDWLDTRTDQLGRIERYTYDLAGNVTQFQDRKNQFTTWAAYDARNRPTTVTYQDSSTMTYNFDAGGRLWQLTDSLSGTITRKKGSSRWLASRRGRRHFELREARPQPLRTRPRLVDGASAAPGPRLSRDSLWRRGFKLSSACKGLEGRKG